MIQEMYGKYYRSQTISNISKAVDKEVRNFRQRKLSSKYAIVFLDATYVPLSRDIYSRGRVRDRQEILNDFKKIHNSETLTEGKLVLRKFVLKWHSRYPKLMESIQNNGHPLTFLYFPKAIRHSIYSTNLIKSFNKKFKRQVKKHEQFPNEASVERVLITVISDYNFKFSSIVHQGFKQCQDTLDSMFCLVS